MKNIDDKTKLYVKGLNFFYKKDYLNSKNYFERILSLDPTNKESLNLFVKKLEIMPNSAKKNGNIIKG